MTAPATEKPSPALRFGKVALPWNPLPYMDEYLENLQVDERSPDYIRMVKVGLGRFATFLTEQGVTHPEEIERMHILRFQAHLNEMNMAVSYKQQLLKYVRSWINWLDELDYITDSPWVRIKVGVTPKKPKPLEDEEIALIFDAHKRQAFSISPFVFHRREVILCVLYGWGLRIHELQSLNVTQMDLRQDYVTVRNKGGTKKTLPYGDTMKQVIQRWLRIRASKSNVGEDALLVGSNGDRMSIQMIRKIVTEIGHTAGVSINPHRLRDTFGTTMLDNDVEVERIMKMMGHTQRSQTLAYARVNDHKLKESHDRVMDPILDHLLVRKPGAWPN